MHIPSERVYHEMRSENACLWVVPANSGEDVSILIKAPTSAIKALIAGCPLHLIFGRKDQYLMCGVRILDIPDAPIMISGVQRQAEEHHALSRLLADKKAPVFLFNEMDVCLAWTNLELQEGDTKNIVELLDPEPNLYAGPFNPDCSYALDCFCYSTDPTDTYPNVSTIPLVITHPLLESWRSNNHTFIGIQENHTISIDDSNEGEIFERSVWASLESVFPLTIHKSPQVKIGEKLRELTDVLAFHTYGNFLIESKDLSVLQAGYERDQQRRTNSTQKQVKKAIIQLVGASKAIMRGERVFDKAGKELNLVHDQPAHCIVLITELMHWGDWTDIEQELVQAMESTRAFFHLLDLREFITLLKGSSGDPRLLDYNLMERCKLFIQKGSVHIRGQIAQKPSPRSMTQRDS